MQATTTRHRPPARGAAALVVVMVLFFIMSLVAAYASRNLIFEQRTSANNYRSTQAFEAAEAGLEWALAMLNGGRIDEFCVGTTDLAKTTFRDRYLQPNPLGQLPALSPSCVSSSGNWACSCPSAGNAALAAPTGNNATPTFSVAFTAVGGQLGLVRVSVQGCSSFGTPCFPGAAGRADAETVVDGMFGLAPALTQTSLAAMTVRGDLFAQDARFANPFAEGVAINAGGNVFPDPDTNPNITGPAGTPVRAAQKLVVVQGDDSLSLADLVLPGGLSRGEMMFLAAFGAPPAAYRLQPAVVHVDCSADCATRLQAAADGHPGRVLWIDGDPEQPTAPVLLPAATVMTLGSTAAPVVLVLARSLSIGAGSVVVFNGLVYVRGGAWDATGSDVRVNGVVIAEGEAAGAHEGRFTISGAPRIAFDPTVTDVLKKVQARQVLDFGSFARLPGSWRDFR